MTDHRPPGTVVGVDVSKALLDVCLHPSGDRCGVRNDVAGIEELRDYRLESSAGLVVMEATGRYRRAAHTCLHEAGIPVAFISRLAKTDEIDEGPGRVRRRHEARAHRTTNREDGADHRDHRCPAAGGR